MKKQRERELKAKMEVSKPIFCHLTLFPLYNDDASLIRTCILIHNVVDSSKLAAISHLLIGMWLCSGSFEAYIVVHYIPGPAAMVWPVWPWTYWFLREENGVAWILSNSYITSTRDVSGLNHEI